LRMLDTRAGEGVEKYIRHYFTTAPADRKALQEMVDGAKIAPDTKKRLLEIQPK
jgi:hypothetical protein